MNSNTIQALVIFGPKRWRISWITYARQILMSVALLIAIGLSKASAMEDSVNTFNVYSVTTVEQSHVIYSHFPKASTSRLDSIYDDIERIYPIGKPAFLSFNNATWFVASDGIATVQLELPRMEGLRETVTLNGIWTSRNGLRQLHMAGTGLYGLKIAFDGLVHSGDDGLQMDGIFTATIRGASHVERVGLHLNKLSNRTPNQWAVANIEGLRQTEALGQLQRQEYRPLSEPSEWIGGVPVPTNYDVEKFKVNLEGAELAPMEGQLLLSRVDGPAGSTISIVITTNGSVMPGWSGWVINAEGNKNSQHGIAVTTSNGHIQVGISPATAFPIHWYTQKTDRPDEVVLVLADEVSIDIQVNGNDFNGTINAKGRLQEGNHTVSTFSATLSGKRQNSEFIKEIASFIGVRPFDGKWRADKLGELNLHQHDSKVSGEFHDGRSIEGTVSGAVLDLIWKSSAGKNGTGFLSCVGNGFLVGMLWEGEQNSSFEPIVAIQSLPTARPADLSKHVPDPTTDAEALELKFLGYDLHFAGKHQEATEILDKVVSYYARAKELENDPSSYSDYSVSQVLPLLDMMESASAAGDYPALVKALTMAVKVQKEMGKDAISVRNFRQQVRKYIVEIEKSAETMGKLADAFDKGLKLLSASGIGINFEEEKNTSGIKITGVRADMPAGRAGIIPGDVLLAINGVPVADMSVDQANIRLRGDVGSTVTITLSRSGHPMDIKLVRASLTNLGAKWRQDLAKAIAGLRDLAVLVSQEYLSDATALKPVANAMESQSTEKLDVKAAFSDLTGRIERLLSKLEKKRSEMVALARQSIAESPNALGLFDRFVLLQNEQVRNRRLDNAGMERMQKLDQDEEEFEKSLDESEINKEMLRLSIMTFSELNSMSIKASGRLRLVKQAVESSSQASNSDQTAQHLADLAVRLDNWRLKMVTDAAKIDSLEYGQNFYVNFVQTLVDLNLPEQAMVASEAARARAFADLLATPRRADGELNQSSFPKGVLSYWSAPPLSLQEIKDIAAAQKGTVIEYFLLPGHSSSATNQDEKDYLAIWTVAPEKNTTDVTIKMIQVPVNIKRLNTDINRLVGLMAESLAGEEGSNKRTEVAGLLHRLNDKLIEPLEKHQMLPIDPEAKTLITVIPHRDLFSVPFAALLDGTDKYLVEKYSLNYATALSVMKYTQANKPNAGPSKQRHFLALVNPEPLPKSEEGIEKKPLQPLLKTASNFSIIANFYSPPEACEIYTGAEATSLVLRERAANADVLYFATHAEIKPDDPLNSFIALAKTKQHDGYFRVSEVSELNLRAELVILAACETGRGKLSSDGINGLSRAFTQAGASALLMSLWKVPEDRTTMLMTGFHHYWLQEKQKKAESLQSAQRKLLNSEIYRIQPNLWAGFVLFGSSN